MQPNPAAETRDHSLDAIRAFALLLGVVFHAAESFEHNAISLLINLVAFPLLFLSDHYLVRSTFIGQQLNGRRFPFHPIPNLSLPDRADRRSFADRARTLRVAPGAAPGLKCPQQPTLERIVVAATVSRADAA